MLYEILPEKFTGGLFIVIIIGLAKLYDNLMGNNNAIIFNSDYYRVVLFFGVLLAVTAIIFNMILIPLYGIEGSAIATFLAIIIYNTLKLVFVKMKLKMHPFSFTTIKVLFLLALFTFSFYYIEFWFHPIINIILKSIIVVLLYLVVIYKFNFSEDINTQLKKYLPFL
jgi:O-antigen/teichoic acid export membrane protein